MGLCVDERRQHAALVLLNVLRRQYPDAVCLAADEALAAPPAAVLVSHQVLHRNLGQQLVGDAHEHLGQLKAQLRHHSLQHFVPVAAQEQVGRLGCKQNGLVSPQKASRMAPSG